ncbi:MAG: hypothetical protein OXH28_12490 [bacterium]|nr:hypothetical protein [bacterium]
MRPRRAAAVAGVTVLLGSLLTATAAVAQAQSVPELSVAGVTVQEGNRNMVFTVRMNRTSDEHVEVYYSTEAGTATRNLDYIEAAGRLMIPAGQRTGRIVVPVLDDTLDEETETFTLRLFDPDGATLAGAIGGIDVTGTITDDNDPATDLVVENVYALEGKTITFSVTLLTNPGDKTVKVNYRTVNGTAVASRPGRPGDYEPVSGTLEWPTHGTQSVTVNLLRDDFDEYDETFGLSLTNASNASAPRDAATAVIGDTNWLPTLSVGDVEGEEGETFTFTVSMDWPSAREVTARYATFDGSAVAGSDYSARRGMLRFPPGATERTVSVPTRNDALDEDDTEVFTLELLWLTNALYADGGRGGWGTGTIVDNDEPGEPPDTTPGGNVGRTPGGGSGTPGGGSGTPGGGSGTPGGGGGGLPASLATVAPRIKALLSDAVLQVGAPPFRLDLATVLGASTDSYRAFAADARIVTVVVSGSGMTLIPVAPGTTTVSVIARNSKGSALQSFRVTVVPAGSGGSPVDSLRVTTIERSAPAIVTLLGDQALTVGDPATVLDLAPAFGHAVGATYRAVADDPRPVTVAVSGSNLSLTGLAPGVTTVSIFAENARGVAMQTFRVTVRN